MVWGLVITLVGGAASVYLSLYPPGGTDGDAEATATESTGEASQDADATESAEDETASPTGDPTADPTTSPTQQPTVEPTALPTEPAFEARDLDGTGDAVLPLPEGATYGIITAEYTGNEDFTVVVLDGAGSQIGDDLVDADGAYEGTTAFGLDLIGSDEAGDDPDAPSDLRIEAEGEWTVRIAPVQDAPELALPARSQGDVVLQWLGDAATPTLTSVQDLTLAQVTAEGERVLIEDEIAEIVAIELQAGPSLVVIRTEGAWTLE